MVSPVGAAFAFGDDGYRDSLCALIDHVVVAVRSGSDVGVVLDFDHDWSLRLRPAWSDVRGPEIGTLSMNDDAGDWDVWRPGEHPFESDVWVNGGSAN